MLILNEQGLRIKNTTDLKPLRIQPESVFQSVLIFPRSLQNNNSYIFIP